LKTAFFVHAQADREFAGQLAEFLEFGCNLTCYVEDGLIGEGQDPAICPSGRGIVRLGDDPSKWKVRAAPSISFCATASQTAQDLELRPNGRRKFRSLLISKLCLKA
jgi:hypothetical protein